MTVGAARKPPHEAVPDSEARPRLPGLRLVCLHAVGRRVPTALAGVVACAVALRLALHWHWDSYGALQLPLVFETGCATAIAISTASPFGDPERATGRWLPFLRLGVAVALTGFASGPVMTFAPASLNFVVPSGPPSAPQTFYVRNSGNQPLTITSAAPPYLGTAYLTVVSDGCSGTTIPPGATCRMIVTFTATQAGSGSATLQIQANTNPTWNNYSAFYSASGSLAQTQSTGNFGYQPQNSTSQPGYVQLFDSGNVPMHVSAVALGGAGASQFAITSDTCTGATIGYGGPCYVYLTFTPTTTGPLQATVSFTDDAPGSPQSETIYGTGIAPGAILSQTAIDFGVVSDAGGNASQVVQVSNPTAQSLHVTTAAISVGGGVFHTSADSCTGATVLPASSCSVTVTFAPTSSFAVFSGTLTVTDDGSPSGHQLVSLAGQGVDPQLTYAPDQINFGNQRQGTRSAAKALTLTNTSSASWTPQGMQLEGTYYGSYNLDASGCTQAAMISSDSTILGPGRLK